MGLFRRRGRLGLRVPSGWSILTLRPATAWHNRPDLRLYLDMLEDCNFQFECSVASVILRCATLCAPFTRAGEDSRTVLRPHGHVIQFTRAKRVTE
jgi:hypothetical protein